MKTAQAIAVTTGLALALVAGRAAAAPLGTAFTYQGVVEKYGSGLNGNCSIKFTLYDALTGGSTVGAPNPNTVSVTATKGLFTTTLDFGALAFNGSNARWLEIAVQGPGDQSYTTLSPRQPITAVPYAMYSLTSGSGGGGLTLPFAGSISSGSTAFSVTNTNPSSNGVFGSGLAGVEGEGTFAGVWGHSTTQYGVYGESSANPSGGVRGRHYGSGPGVEGIGGTGPGVSGTSGSGNGVFGTTFSGAAAGVHGESSAGFGVYGTTSAATKAGVFGQTSIANSSGVLGRAEANSVDAHAVFGYASSGGVGVRGASEGGDGMVASSNAANKSGIWAFTTNANGYGAAFNNFGGGVAVLVSGLAQVTTLQILGGADLAEPFDVAPAQQGGTIEPGMVVSIDAAKPGDLRLCDRAYDTRVAGVISGANGLKPGMVMASEGSEHADGEHPVAMTGRVWCWVDASQGAITPGDLLTTSDTPGHAMKATDVDRRAGAVIGKAMTGLERGRGLVLVLVSLQ